MSLEIGDYVTYGMSPNLYRLKEIRLGKTQKGKLRQYDLYWDLIIADDPSHSPYVLNRGLYLIPKMRFPNPLSQEDVIRSIFFPRKNPVFDFK
jgi:hypothetical protein